MKKIMLIIIAVVAFSSCEKKELTDVEKINCLQQFDQEVANVESLARANFITASQAESKINQIKNEYYDCLKRGADNK